jgi:endoglucanase
MPLARFLVTVAASATLVATMAAPAHAAASPVTCQYSLVQWPGGFSADLAITNNGPTINGWFTHWTVDAPTTLGGVWQAVMWMPTPRDMVATNTPSNAVIPTGARVSFGWTAIAPSTDVPTDITVNGMPC